jgi:hypothetical protein
MFEATGRQLALTLLGWGVSCSQVMGQAGMRRKITLLAAE